MERTPELRVISLLEGLFCIQIEEDCALLGMIKDIEVNLATLPLQTLHALHQGVLDKLRIREKQELIVINKVMVNNEKIFAEKAQALKEKEDLEVQSHSLEAIIT